MPQGPQSPIGEPAPIEAVDPPKVEKRGPSEMERIARQFPKFQEYIEGKIRYYQQFLPTGESITSLKDEERAKRWSEATTIIAEFEQLRRQVIANTRKDG